MSNFHLILIAVGAVVVGILFFVALRILKKKPSRLDIQPQGANQPTINPWWTALSKTRAQFFFNKKFKGEMSLLKESLEEACLVSDLGVTNTTELLSQVKWDQVANLPEDDRLEFAKNEIATFVRPWIAQSSTTSLNLEWLLKHKTSGKEGPVVVWFVGVNGVGKTTSISKLAAEILRNNHTVLLGAGDTFRAAASEQLESWADRLQVPVVKGQPGADSSAVLFDAIQSAKAKKIDFVLCDSAGRLHNQAQLMESLKKVHRIMNKAQEGAPHEVLLVLDANTGQNMLSQAEQFQQAVGVSGLILTKLDGTAKGGAVVAVARKTQLPIRRLGLGEKMEDFVSFDPEAFSKALVGLD
jgi:fused signal recognition particle receptor